MFDYDSLDKKCLAIEKRFPHFSYRIFHPRCFDPAFSNPAVWCRLFQFHVFSAPMLAR